MTSFIKKGLCLFFFFMALGLSAQVEISGTIVDDYNSKPIDGAKITPWIVLDFIDVLVHVMNDEFRELYDLENLWGDGEKIDFKPDKSPIEN